MRFEIARVRGLYRSADVGIALLPPRSARCIGTARVLYARILDLIEQHGYDVFTSRVRVPTWQKATLVGADHGRTWLTRSPGRGGRRSR